MKDVLCHLEIREIGQAAMSIMNGTLLSSYLSSVSVNGSHITAVKCPVDQYS